ncbi:MAG: helix-turn-helix domain-containing protein [Hymenobacteraceae bacterium]|nr:helix-turn-helix domain-containing protein [Hymenobacteraceae bacterium]
MIATNLKALRRQRGLTQAQFAEALGLKRSLVGAYEEGRAEPKLTTLVAFARFFDLSVDQFVTLDLSAGRPAAVAAAAGQSPRVLAITVDRVDGDENIELVPLRAAAGYLNGYADPEFVAELPRFRLPLAAVRDGSHRAFEISGDSVLPLASGTVVVGRYLTDPARDVRDGAPCVVVAGTEGIVFKRVYRAGKKNGQHVLELRSDNPAFAPYTIPAADVRELWEARAYLSTAFPPAPAGDDAAPGASLSTSELTALLRDLQREVHALKAK